MSEEEITINIKGPSELKLGINIALSKTVRDLKKLVAEASEVEADRQRLIYSGKVLKDDDVLSVYKIQSGHTVHMVKGAARPAGTDASSSTPQPLPTMAAGQNPTDPLTQLNGQRGFGVMGGFNPFSGMGVNTNDPNMMQSMLESPGFLQQMSAMMSNPAAMEALISSDPNMAQMAPQLRQMFSNPQFQQMISNPESLRQMFQMASQMRAAGVDPMNPSTFGRGLGGGGMGMPFGLLGPGAFGAGSPPAAGATSATSPTGGNEPTNLFAQAAGGGTAASPGAAGGAPNPLAALFGGGAGAGLGGAAAAPGSPGSAGGNPFGMVDPAMMQQMFGGFGGGGGFGGFGGPTSPPAPADTRPVEERFQVQLQQMSEMGLSDASRNIRALLATGGNVQAAIEYIFNGNGM